MFIKSIKQAKTRSEIPQAAEVGEEAELNELQKFKMQKKDKKEIMKRLNEEEEDYFDTLAVI